MNDSPLAGREGKFVTSRHIRDRLFHELNSDVSLRVEENPDMENSFKVSGRGELHLSVLIENMRREGYEFAVSKAEVLYKIDENGKKLEPIEKVFIDVPDEFSGNVIQSMSERKGDMINMTPINGGFTRLQFLIPSRGLIGYRGQFMTETRGNGIMNTAFEEYAEYKGEISYRKHGSLIAYETAQLWHMDCLTHRKEERCLFLRAKKFMQVCWWGRILEAKISKSMSARQSILLIPVLPVQTMP